TAPSRNEPVNAVSQAARKAPIMYSEPCARLIMSITPNTSVSPAASRYSMKPSCRPLSACSIRKRPLTAALFGHLALLRIRVAAIPQDRFAERLVDQAALPVAAHRAHIVVLDRVLVVVEFEGSAHRVESGGPQRAPHGFLVLQISLDVAYRGVDELGGIVALRRVERGHALVLFLEFGDELLVGRIVEVGRPVRGVEKPGHGRADRPDHVLVGAEARQQQHGVLAEA